MPPFPIGKATLKGLNPDGRTMRRMERQGTEIIAAALAKLERDLFRGVTQQNAAQIVRRLDDPKVIKPFENALIGLVHEWALAGADFGREQIERDVYGTI